MIKTKSFGLAYELKNEEKLPVPLFDVHINFWNVNGKNVSPFIDFGIKVINFRSIKKLTFSAPFPIKDEDIVDLSYLLGATESQLIFNDLEFNYGTIPKGYSFIYKQGEKIAFVPIKCGLDDNNYINEVTVNSNQSQNFNVSFNISQYRSFPQDTTAIYFRFRIKSNKLVETLMKKLKEKNYYLESAFVERQIIDIKFNDARNMNRSDFNNIKKDTFEFAKFKSVHLFLMVPSSYEVTVLDNFSECRQLEDGWNNYLQNKDNKKTKNKTYENLIVYHWKKKAKHKNDSFDKFTQLIKLEYKDTNLKLLLFYCIVVIILGAFGSGLAEKLF